MTGSAASSSIEAGDDVEGALQRAVNAALPKSFGEDHPARIEHVEAHLAGLALEEGHQLDDLDAFEPAFEQLVHREAAASVVHRDDDLVDALRAHRAAADRPVRDLVALGGTALGSSPSAGNVADDDEAATIRATAQPGDAAGAPTGAVDEHAALEDVLVDERVEDDAHDHRAARMRTPRLSSSAPRPICERREQVEDDRR